METMTMMIIVIMTVMNSYIIIFNDMQDRIMLRKDHRQLSHSLKLSQLICNECRIYHISTMH